MPIRYQVNGQDVDRLPDAGKMVRNAADAAARLARAIASRERVAVDKSEYDRRLSICGDCENMTGNRCRLCGCFLAGKTLAKARWATETCPANKW